MLLIATSVLSLRPNTLIDNTTVFLEKPISTDFVNFGKGQDRFGQFHGPNLTPLSETKTSKPFRRMITETLMDRIDYHDRVLTIFSRLRSQVVAAADSFCRE